jgi:outer membrane receptor for ferrienterochelin and colicins
MDDIVVSGTLRPVKRLESPVAVEVYTRQFFRMNPVPSLFESMQLVNGVRPQVNCNICTTGDIHINGLEGPYTMVTIDGMPIVSSLSSVYGLFGIPSQLIERVEIVKGPASSLYGSEAVGGLINIITRSPNKAPLLSVDLMTSSWKEVMADIGLRWRAGKRVTALTGVHFFHYDNPVDGNADGFTDMALQRRISLFQKWQFNRRDGKVAGLAARYFYEDRWGGDMRWTPAFRGGDSLYGESIYTNRVELIGNTPLLRNIDLSWSYNSHWQDSWYGNTPYLAQQHVGFAQAIWQKTLGKHMLLSGLTTRFTYYDDNSPATTKPDGIGNQPSRVMLPGLFVQDEWKFANRYTLLAAMRADHHPDHGIIFTPRVAFKWNAGNAGVFRVNAGTGFRVVNLFTEDHAALTGARQVVIDGRLDPEQSVNINLNYVLLVPFYHSYLNIDASLWHTRFSNQIVPDYNTNPNQIIYQNLDGYALSQGFSLNTEYNWNNRIFVQAGTTLQDVRQFRENANGIMEATQPVLTESWSGVWALGYRFPRVDIRIDYTGNVYGPMRLPLVGSMDPRPESSPVWSVQNLQVSKRFGERFEIYGGVRNLLNWTPDRGVPFLIARAHDPFDKQVEYDAAGQVLATPRNPYALTFDPGYVYAPNQGRRLVLGFRFIVPGSPSIKK